MMNPEDQLRRLESDIQALRELANSRGWAVIKAVIEDEIRLTAIKMADNYTLTEAQLRFFNGRISGAANLAKLPEALITQKVGELEFISSPIQRTNQAEDERTRT